MENLFVLNQEEKVVCVFDNFVDFKKKILTYIISFLIFEQIYPDEKTAGIKELENFRILFTTSQGVTIGNKRWKKTEIKKNYIDTFKEPSYKTKFAKLKIIGQHLTIKSIEEPLPFVSLEGFC